MLEAFHNQSLQITISKQSLSSIKQKLGLDINNELYKSLWTYKGRYDKYLHPVEVNTSIAQFCSKYRRENTAFIASKGHLPCKQSIYTRTCKVKNLET